jgi:hypothetical protein
MYFYTCDLNLTCAEPDLDADFVFHLQVHPKPEKTLKPGKPPKKTQNLKETKKPRKKLIYKTRRAPEPDPKPDGFSFRCQISLTGSGVKFNLIIFFHRSGFWSTRPVAIPNRAHQWWGRGWHNVSFHATTCPTTYQEATKKTRKTREQGGQREENMEKCKNSLSRPKSMVQVWDPPMTFRKIVK